MKKNTNTNCGPGRPMYQPVIPRGKFTMTEFCEANGVNIKTGKGKNCSKLTLIKFLGRKQGKALVVRVKGETADPNSKKGLGRKAFLYTRRAGVNVPKSTAAPKATHAPRKAKTVTVDVGLSQTTQDYEAQKAALLAPVAPTAPVVTPDPTPAVETPAPEVVADVAPEVVADVAPEVVADVAPEMVA